MSLINLTNQSLTLYDTDGELVELSPDPRHVAVSSLGEHQTVEDDEGHVFSLNVRYAGAVKTMPPPQEGTLYVVPPEVAMLLQGHREDVVFPAEDRKIRDGEGQLRRITHLRRIVPQTATDGENGHRVTPS